MPIRPNETVLATHPELVRTVSAHEPPLFNLLDERDWPDLTELRAVLASVAGRLDANDREGAARLYSDRIAMAAHGWEGLAPARRAMLLANAGTYHDQCRDRDAQGIELGSLCAFTGPALTTTHPDSYIEAEAFATGVAYG